METDELTLKFLFGRNKNIQREWENAQKEKSCSGEKKLPTRKK